jgi:hypothetical protein
MTTEPITPQASGRVPPNPMASRPRKRRASRARLRATAWVAAGVSLASPWVALKLAPKPASAAGNRRPRQVVIVHRTVRRIVIDPAAPASASVSGGAPQVRYVYVGGGTVSSGGGSAGTSRCSGC